MLNTPVNFVKFLYDLLNSIYVLLEGLACYVKIEVYLQ